MGDFLLERLHKQLHKHIQNHKHEHIHKLLHIAKNAHHNRMHLGEVILVTLIGFCSLIFAGTNGLPNNDSFDYPLQQISTIECRTMSWDTMPDNCKINLPKIQGANYAGYIEKKVYTDTYSTLRGGSYDYPWDQTNGAHDGIDIATARGTPLYSVGNGKIYFAGKQSGYGNVVKIEYLFKGEIIYVTYGHMDTIDVKTGENVSKGQKIGTVGNSGNVFGTLGGYHVHFSISKEFDSKPIYAFRGCKDLSKGDYYIVQNGLCRTDLAKNSYDPIKILESIPYKQGLSNTNSNNSSNTNNTTGAINTGNTSSGASNIIISNNNNLDNNIELDFSDVSDISEHFLSQWDISLETTLKNNKLKLGEPQILKLTIKKKNSNEYFEGILPVTLNLISNNTNIDISYSSIQLIGGGKADIIVSGKKTGTSTILISLGGTKIAKIPVSIE